MTSDVATHEAIHAARLIEALRARIAAAGGWLPFDAYMDFVLYAPGLGYYSAGARKLGAGGDFADLMAGMGGPRGRPLASND